MEKRASNTSHTVIEKTKQSCAELFDKSKYSFLTTQWDDCQRFQKSCWGNNIADWRYQLKDGTVVPGIRGDNYRDQTLCIPASKIGIVVGNHVYGENIRTVSFEHYLENYGKYTTGVHDGVNLSSGKDEMVTIRFMSFIIPEEEDGSQQVVPTVYSYGTCDSDDPQNYVGISTHFGTASHTNTSGTESIYLVEPKEDGSFNDSWIRVTSADCETKEQKSVASAKVGVRSNDESRNCIVCFQIPRRQYPKTPELRSRGGPTAGDDGCCYRSLSMGNVSIGDTAREHKTRDIGKHERNPDENVTLTCSFYYMTRDGEVSEENVSKIIERMEQCYQEPDRVWRGCLPTGEVVADQVAPPIKLPEADAKVVAECQQQKPILNKPASATSLEWAF